MKNTKLPTPSGFKKAKPGELKPNMRYWLSTDGQQNHFRNVAITYGDNKFYTEMMDKKVLDGILFIKNN